MTKKNTQPNGYLPSVLKEKLKLLIVAAAFVAGGAQAADKHAISAMDWHTGTWYDAATGGNPVAPPAVDDNVFTNGFAITIADDATCANLTFTNVVGQIGIAAGKTLTIRGKVDCDVAGTADAFSTSNATSILKLTGSALTTSPYIIITDKAIPGIRVKNLVIQAADSKTYQFGETGVTYTHGTGKFTVKNGTPLEVKTIMVLGQGSDNELIIEDGATITTNNHIKGASANFSNITKATINGTLSNSAFTGVKDLVLGTNGKLISGRGVYKTTEYVTFEGWWGTASTVTAASTGIGTPNSVLLGSNSTIEFNKAGDQRLNGIVPANGTAPAEQYSIPYANLTLSGSGVKTIQSNLSFSGAMNVALGVTTTVASGVTLTIPSGATLNVSAGGKVTNNGTIVNEGTINYLSDATNGTATYLGSGTISGAGTVNVNQSLQHPAGALRTWYVASPVASFDPAGMSTIKYFDETLNNASPADNWTSTTTMIANKGYVITPANAANNLLFTGALNDGEQNITLTSRTGTENKAGFNLIGNPYLSYLDWNAVAAANTGDMRSTTLWYRTKNGSSYNFWTVNGDGVGVPNGASALIPPMQAFWVRAVEGGSTLNLTNAMRAHAPSSDKLLKAPAVNNRTLVRLQVSNGVNTDEAVIYFSENAQNGFDSYDAPKMSNENVEIPEIYTTLGAERIVINSMNSIPTNSAIGLGFVAGNASSFSLKAYEVSNIPEGVKVMLRDNVTLAETDLTDGTASYGFTPQPSSGDRFSLIFRTAGNSTGVQNVNKSAIKAYVNAYKQLVISATKNSNYAIYNALGQQIENGILKADLQTINSKLQTGLYVVKVNNQSIRVVAP